MKKLAFSVFAAALTFGANADVEVNDAATQACCGYDGFYFGLGAAAVDSGLSAESFFKGAEIGKESKSATRLGGTLTLGYGRRVKEKAYIGLEAGLDATQNVEVYKAEGYSPVEDDSGSRIGTAGVSSCGAHINGLIPSVALKLGYLHPATKSLVYLKAGVAFPKAKWVIDDDREVKNSKISPIVALGYEKLCGKIRTRLEAEYRFSSNKSKEDGNVEFKLKNKGAITLRAMAIYTVKM